jgi:hypothetical protein
VVARAIVACAALTAMRLSAEAIGAVVQGDRGEVCRPTDLGSRGEERRAQFTKQKSHICTHTPSSTNYE